MLAAPAAVGTADSGLQQPLTMLATPVGDETRIQAFSAQNGALLTRLRWPVVPGTERTTYRVLRRRPARPIGRDTVIDMPIVSVVDRSLLLHNEPSFHALNTQNMKPEPVSPIMDTEGSRRDSRTDGRVLNCGSRNALSVRRAAGSPRVTSACGGGEFGSLSRAPDADH